MPKKVLGRVLMASDRTKARKYFATEARRIQRLYAKRREEYRLACLPIPGAPMAIGRRRVTRSPVPPYNHPDAFAKRQVYEMVLAVASRRGWCRELEAYLRERHPKNVQKPRVGDAVDWVLRLFNYWTKVRADAGLVTKSPGVVSQTIMYRWAIELRFALKNRIRPELVNMFIDAVGGHEIISATESHKGYNFSSADWLPLMKVHGSISTSADLDAERDRRDEYRDALDKKEPRTELPGEGWE